MCKMVLELLRRIPPETAASTSFVPRVAGVKRRTLEKHFRRFLCRTPVEVRRDLRLERARRDLLRAQSGVTVTEIALHCGFNHLGRFAALYRAHFGESPSATLGRSHHVLALGGGSSHLSVDRPAVSITPFHLAWKRRASPAIAEEIAARLCRNRSLAVTEPGHARYQLRGSVRAERAGRLRVMVWLIDAATRR